MYKTRKMSDDFEKRKTKKDKARRNKEYNGKYSPKHVRQQEILLERRQQMPKIEEKQNIKDKN